MRELNIPWSESAVLKIVDSRGHDVCRCEQWEHQEHIVSCVNAMAKMEAFIAAAVLLGSAADAFRASQEGATDPRCGLVQPVTVQECTLLNTACACFDKALRELRGGA